MNKEKEVQENYAVIELMGHQKMIGRYSEITIAGKGFLRVAILNGEGTVIRTRDINPESVYAINPITRETCLLECNRNHQEVAVPYDLEMIIIQRLEAGNSAKDVVAESGECHEIDEADDSVWG